MASVPVNDLLQGIAIRAMESRYTLQRGLQTILGMQRGGPNVTVAPFRDYKVDIVNDNADVAPGLRPGARSLTLAESPVGKYDVTVQHSTVNTPLIYERLNQFRPIGGPVSMVDELGQTYVSQQLQKLSQRINNIREFQCAAMLRGSYTYTQSGDALQQNFTGGTITIDFQMPSGNKNQLNMLGAGNIVDASWATASTHITSHISKVSAAFTQLTGQPLTDMILTSVGWENLKNNTDIRNQGGSAQEPFLEQNRDPITGLIRARLRSHPWVNIWAYDNGLNLGAGGTGNFSKLIDDTACVFISQNVASATKRWQYAEYISPVVETYGGPAVNQIGEYFWTMNVPDPATVFLYGKMDGIPELTVPASIAYGTVVF